MIHNTELAKNTRIDDYVGTPAGADFDVVDANNVITYRNDEGPSFYFMRGCGEDYTVQAPIYAGKVGSLGTLHFPYQTEGVHSQDYIDSGIIEAASRDDGQDKVFVATSMGLMNTMRSFENPAVLEAIGEDTVVALISLSGMTSKHDLNWKMRAASHVSSRVLGIPFVESAWRQMRVDKAYGRDHRSPNTTENERLAHYLSSALMPGELLASQHEAIARSKRWRFGALGHVAVQQPRMELFQISADFDAVVNRHKSKVSTQDTLALPVETKTEIRFPGSHADDPEFIELLAERMAKIRGVRHQLLVGAVNLEASYASLN